MKSLPLVLLLMVAATMSISSVSPMMHAAQRAPVGAITGQLRNMDGTPASGVRVGALGVDSVGPGNVIAELTGQSVTDSDGRFRIDGLPPGAYYLTAGFIELPTLFPGVKTIAEARSVSVAAGATVQVADFSLVRSAGVRIAGVVRPLPGGLPRDAVRVLLQSASSVPLDVGIAADGSFEFPRVANGRYVPRVMILGLVSVGPVIVVDDRDVTGVDLAPSAILVGRVEVEQGGLLPVSFNVASNVGAVPDAPSFVQVQTRRIDAAGPVNAVSNANATATVRADGFFSLHADPGDYQFALAQIPVGYYLRSASYGAADLLKTSLRIGIATSETVRIVLTTTRPADAPPEFKVSGRLTGLPAGTPGSARSLTFTMSAPGVGGNVTASARYIGEPVIHEDGTFELLRAPSGSWSISVLDLVARVQSKAQSIFVGDRDVTGIEVFSPVTASFGAAPPPALTAMASSRLNSPASVELKGRFVLDGVAVWPEELSRLQLTAQTGSAQRLSFPQADVIALQLPKGAYNLSVSGLPKKFTVASITYGNLDLRTAPLEVNAPLTSEVVVRIAAFPPPGTFPKVSGRVSNLPAAPYIQNPRIILTRDTQAGGGAMETPVDKEGSFVFNGVPPGPYTLTTAGLTADYSSKLEVKDTGTPSLTVPLAGLAAPFFPGASVASAFTSNSEITLRGIITQTVTYIRPNAPVAYIRMNVIDSADRSGEPRSWAVVLFNVPRSGAAGLAEDIAKFKVGTRVVVVGNPANDGSNRVSLVARTGPAMSLGIEIVPD